MKEDAIINDDDNPIVQLFFLLKDKQSDKKSEYQSLISCISLLAKNLDDVAENLKTLKQQSEDSMIVRISSLESLVDFLVDVPLQRIKAKVYDISENIVNDFKESGINFIGRTIEFSDATDTFEFLTECITHDILQIDKTISEINTNPDIDVSISNDTLLLPLKTYKETLYNMEKTIIKALAKLDKLSEKARPSVLKALQEKPVKPVETITKAKEKDISI